ncbi:MAG: HD domain-containing protein [Gammaproteobacteria bacterium]
MTDALALIFKALEFAARKHRDQRRKDADATPYINHPIELAKVLVNEGNVADLNVLVAAILHDTVEDTTTTEEEIEKVFGKSIADIVMEVTDDKSLLKDERKSLQVKNATHCSREAKLVKLADKICNLRDISKHPPVDWSVKRKQEYFDWSKQVIDGIRGVNTDLEKLFDMEYENKPNRQG